MLTAEQLQARKAGIGGSDIAGVLNMSPWNTPLDVYNDKLGLVDPADLSANENVHFGNVLEGVVADEFARRTGLKVRRNNQHIVHRDLNFLMANIDRSVVGKPMGLRCGLECKTTDKWAARPELWGEGAVFAQDSAGSLAIAHQDDQVPDHYALQCHQYMAVTGSDMWFLAVLVGGNNFRIYTIFRDPEIESFITERASSFWNDNVIAGIPPAPSNVVDMETMFAMDNGLGVVASQDIIDTWVEVKELQAQKKAIDQRLDGTVRGKMKIGGLKNKLRMAIGENSEILLDSDQKPIATWKAPKAGKKFFDMARFEEENPDLAAQYTKKIPGSRVLLIK